MFGIVVSVLMSVFAAWLFARRLRRTTRRRRLDIRRIRWRLIVLSVIALILALHGLSGLRLFFATLVGAAAGAALGWLGLRLAEFEDTAEGRYYLPHRYLGLSVSAVLVARLIYRSLVLCFPVLAFNAASQSGALTQALVFLVLCYYLVFYRGLLRIARGEEPPRLATDNDDSHY